MTSRLAVVVCLFGSGILIHGCFRGAARTEDHRLDSLRRRESPVLPPPRPIQAGNCRVVARVVAIDSSRTTGDSADPCSRTPCRATVLVETVLGIGSDFPDNLVRSGDLLVLAFPGTLLPHDERFNGLLVKSYPGLLVASRFRADLTRDGAVGGGVYPEDDLLLTAYDYDLLDE